MTTIRQIKALRHYAGELALARHADIALPRTLSCGCTLRRVVGTLGFIREAYEVAHPCAQHTPTVAFTSDLLSRIDERLEDSP